VRRGTEPDHLSSTIHSPCGTIAAVIWDVEVNHPAGLRPQKRMAPSCSRPAGSNDLTAIVETVGVTRPPAERSKIDHSGLNAPEKGVRLTVADDLTPPHHLTLVVDCDGNTLGTAERSEINQAASARPGVRMTTTVERLG
jgi:hypothetical protein